LSFWATHKGCSIIVSKFGVDPIFAVEDLRLYDFASLAGKCLITPFSCFWGFESLKMVGRHQNPQKAHSWMKMRHLSKVLYSQRSWPASLAI